MPQKDKAADVGTSNKSDEGYASVIREMQKDANRTAREREVERAMDVGGSIEIILRDLLRDTNGNKNAVRRRINDALAAAHTGPEEPEKLSRNTLYSWLDKHDLG